MTPHETAEDVFESRLRTGIPRVRSLACQVWSEVRLACELEDLIAVGSRVLVEAARQAVSDAEFFGLLDRDLRPALRVAAGVDPAGKEAGGGAPELGI